MPRSWRLPLSFGSAGALRAICCLLLGLVFGAVAPRAEAQPGVSLTWDTQPSQVYPGHVRLVCTWVQPLKYQRIGSTDQFEIVTDGPPLTGDEAMFALPAWYWMGGAIGNQLTAQQTYWTQDRGGSLAIIHDQSASPPAFPRVKRTSHLTGQSTLHNLLLDGLLGGFCTNSTQDDSTGIIELSYKADRIRGEDPVTDGPGSLITPGEDVELWARYELQLDQPLAFGAGEGGGCECCEELVTLLEEIRDRIGFIRTDLGYASYEGSRTLASDLLGLKNFVETINGNVEQVLELLQEEYEPPDGDDLPTEIGDKYALDGSPTTGRRVHERLFISTSDGVRKFKTHGITEMPSLSELGLTAATLGSGASAPTLNIAFNFPAVYGIDLPAVNMNVDFSPFEPYRIAFRVVIMASLLVWGLGRVWSELRRH